MKTSPLALAIAAAFAYEAHAAEGMTLDPVVVTAPRMAEPLTVELDPQAPQQPVPANDGASFLKNIPGFSMIRKGGTDGDPVLRGMAGSRLNILLDGADFHGGCGMRMDPPTAYVFPETFDKVTVIKGPQTVLHGNGNTAGVVLFERDAKSLSQPGGGVAADLMAGSWGRLDGVLSGRYATDKAYIQATATHAQSDDYEDGAGTRVHSAYERQSLTAVAGWTPDANTRLEFSAVGSQAEAAYADRTMDGVVFDRAGYGLKFEKTNLSPTLQKLAAQLNTNYIDHVMDNYSLRTKPAASMYSVNNPDRETNSVKLSADLALGTASLLTLGASWQGNEHTLRKASGMTQAMADAYTGLPRVRDMETDIRGLYGELRHELGAERRLIAGLRLDDWQADRYNSTTGAKLADAGDTLKSGFLRFEQDIAGGTTAFVGLGHAERPMDYWEASTYNGLMPGKSLDPEKNTQLDAGLIWKRGDLNASVSVFYSKVDDYILTYTGMMASPRLSNCASAVMGGMTTWNCSGNVDATRYGGEADMAWRLAPKWTMRGTLAYVYADNDTHDVALAQTPPLEGRIGLDYATGPWTFGGILRLVAEQNRVDPGYGNIVGQDYGATDSFHTLSLNMAYKPSKALLVTAGIDNVFDETYAEHLARDNSFEAGPSTRVNEPGRFVWAKVNYTFQ
jgi:iron complex outermembrane receptor protein